MTDLLKEAADRAGRYLENLDDRTVFPSTEAVNHLVQLDEPLPEEPTDPKTMRPTATVVITSR